MDALIFMFAGAFLFLCGLIVGSRLAKGQEPVALPRFERPKPDPEPEEQGWASRDRPFVEDGEAE